MKFKEIEIGGSYEVGYGQWRKVSIRAELSDVDDVDKAAEVVGKKVDEILFPNGTAVSKSQPQEQQIGMESAINACKTLAELETFQLLVKKQPQFQEAYNNKLKQLQ